MQAISPQAISPQAISPQAIRHDGATISADWRFAQLELLQRYFAEVYVAIHSGHHPITHHQVARDYAAFAKADLRPLLLALSQDVVEQPTLNDLCGWLPRHAPRLRSLGLAEHTGLSNVWLKLFGNDAAPVATPPAELGGAAASGAWVAAWVARHAYAFLEQAHTAKANELRRQSRWHVARVATTENGTAVTQLLAYARAVLRGTGEVPFLYGAPYALPVHWASWQLLATKLSGAPNNVSATMWAAELQNNHELMRDPAMRDLLVGLKQKDVSNLSLVEAITTLSKKFMPTDVGETLVHFLQLVYFLQEVMNLSAHAPAPPLHGGLLVGGAEARAAGPAVK